MHDFATDARLFDGVLRPGGALTARAACVALDLRGFGRSPDPCGRYSRIDDLAAVHAGVGEGAAHLVGAGLGGTVALEYALARPAAVASVSLVSSGLPGHAWTRGFSAFSPLPMIDVLAPPAGDSAEVAAARERAKEWVRASPEWREALGRGGPVADALLAMFRDYSAFHFWGDDVLDPDPFDGAPLAVRVREVRAPVLSMVGELEGPAGGDAADFGQIGEEIVSVVPAPAFGRREVVSLAGAGHFGTLQAAAECEKHIARFWDSLEEDKRP